MKKTFAFWSLLAMLIGSLALAGCAKKNQSAESPDNQAGKASENKSAADSDEETSFAGTLYDLINAGKAVKCSSSFNENGMEMSGTYYIDPASEKSRIDIQTKLDTGENGAQEYLSHMITLGETTYTWKDGDKTGMKITATEEEGESAEADAASEDIDEEMFPGGENPAETALDFKCRNWKVDSSLFAPPSDVEFTDMAEMLKGLEGITGQMEGLQTQMETLMGGQQ